MGDRMHRRLIEERFEKVRLCAADVLQNAAPEPVHDLRVATRRLSAALRVLGNARGRKLRSEVDALKDAIGPLRDLHVYAQWLGRDGEAEKVEAVHAAIGRFERNVSVRGTAIGDGHRAKVRRRIAKLLARLDERVATAVRSFTPETIHAARITAKKLRYALELVDEDAAVRVLKALQDKLGALHDLDVVLARVEAPQLQEERNRRAPAVRQALRRFQGAKTIAKLRAALYT